MNELYIYKDVYLILLLYLHTILMEQFLMTKSWALANSFTMISSSELFILIS